jgi:hypothetical protein
MCVSLPFRTPVKKFSEHPFIFRWSFRTSVFFWFRTSDTVIIKWWLFDENGCSERISTSDVRNEKQRRNVKMPFINCCCAQVYHQRSYTIAYDEIRRNTMVVSNGRIRREYTMQYDGIRWNTIVYVCRKRLSKTAVVNAVRLRSYFWHLFSL